jgi:hypothetical protein
MSKPCVGRDGRVDASQVPLDPPGIILRADLVRSHPNICVLGAPRLPRIVTQVSCRNPLAVRGAGFGSLTKKANPLASATRDQLAAITSQQQVRTLSHLRFARFIDIRQESVTTSTSLCKRQ